MNFGQGRVRVLSIKRLINRFSRIDTEEAKEVVAVLTATGEEKRDMKLYKYYQEQYPHEEDSGEIDMKPLFNFLGEIRKSFKAFL